MIDALLEAVRLKALARAGWVRVGVPDPESVAAHSWGVGLLVLLFLPDDLDRARALTYAVLHDLPEVRVGDLTPQDAVPANEKARREAVAMDALVAPLPRGGPLAAAWHGYEAQADPEARFVKQLDRLDMAIQAVAYAGSGDRSEFLRSAARGIDHPALVPVLDALVARHSALQSSSEGRTRTS